jgi:Mrp family chromosome partitioning ATPase
MGPQPKVGTSTAILTPLQPGVSVGPRRTVSSQGHLPASSGWDVHEVADARVEVLAPEAKAPQAKAPEAEAKPAARPIPEVATEVIEAAPITARMLRTATPTDVRRPDHAPVPVQAAAVPTTALAVRPYEPSYPVRHSLSGSLDKRLVILTEPHSARAASFRLLRDSLVSKSMPRVVAVTSPLPNDGKTTCAINLALSLAELNATRVLLIDGNFFEPELASIFGIDRLTPIVPPDGGAWLAPYKLAEITPGLHAAGIVTRPGEPPPRFEQQRFEAMIDRLVRVSYDYIVIDSPAMRATPAVIQMISTADGTLLAVRSGGTTARDLRRAAEQIPKNKALGIALVDETPQP